MHRIDGATAAATLPAPEAVSGTPGFFARGNLAEGVPFTTPTVDWANAVQEEIMAVIEEAGLVPDKSDNAQLLAALGLLFVASGGGTGGVLADPGSMPLPGGLIVKWGTSPLASGSNSVSGTVAFNAAFPNGCFCVVGNADRKANASWAPIVVMFGAPTTTGCPYIADSTNTGQSINSGAQLRWIALGH